MSSTRSGILKLKLEGWGQINHTKGQVEDEGPGVGVKQLMNPEESIQKSHLYKTSEDKRGHEHMRTNKKESLTV